MSFDFVEILRLLFVILISFAVHELSHAVTADYLGDDTPRRAGRISLNPLVHLDPVGTLIVVLSVLAGGLIGWAYTPVNPLRLRYGPVVGMGIVSIAGPIANLLLALLSALIFHASILAGVLNLPLALICDTFVYVNVSLFFLNLLPLPPLDGFRILLAFLRLIRGREALQLSERIASLTAYGPMLFIMLIVFDRFLPFSILGLLIGRPASWLIHLLGF